MKLTILTFILTMPFFSLAKEYRDTLSGVLYSNILPGYTKQFLLKPTTKNADFYCILKGYDKAITYNKTSIRATVTIDDEEYTDIADSITPKGDILSGRQVPFEGTSEKIISSIVCSKNISN